MRLLFSEEIRGSFKDKDLEIQQSGKYKTVNRSEEEMGCGWRKTSGGAPGWPEQRVLEGEEWSIWQEYRLGPNRASLGSEV